MNITIDNKKVDIYSEEGLKIISDLWTKVSFHNRVVYEPTWLGIPIIQYPSDIIMMQELIFKIRPDLIIETGVAHGGSAILYSSIFELLGKGRVIGVDIEIREHNRLAIEKHALSKRISLIEGSSIDNETVNKVKAKIKENEKVLVVLDSNHSYEHVLKEMNIYGDMASVGSYMVVMDGIQKMLADTPKGKKEWEKDNPLDAIHTFLEENKNWEIDEHYNRMHVSYFPKGFLKKVEK